MDISTIQELHSLHFITDEQREKLLRVYSGDVFSLQFELRCVLYAGVFLLLTGLVIFAYENIYSFGQQLMVFMLVFLASSCLAFTVAEGPRFSRNRVKYPDRGLDLILLVGCLLLALTLGYAQYAFALFSGEWELVGLVTSIISIVFAYRYDHRGVLSLGIVSLAFAIGLTVSPLTLIRRGFVATSELISVGLAFGTLLLVIAWSLDFSNVKKHFTLTYLHLSAHILFISCLAGVVTEQGKMQFVLILSLLSSCGAYYTKRSRSFSILMITSVYTYIGISYLVTLGITDSTTQSMYILVSCIMTIAVLFLFRSVLSTS